MRKTAAALVCLLTITVSAFALEMKPQVRRDFLLGISNSYRTSKSGSLFYGSLNSFVVLTPVKALDLGLGVSMGKAESFYNLSTFTGSGDFRSLGLQFLLEMKYRQFELEASAGLFALFRGSYSSGFRTLVRTSVSPVVGRARAGNLCFAVGLPLNIAFNASESLFSTGISIRAFVSGEDE